MTSNQNKFKPALLASAIAATLAFPAWLLAQEDDADVDRGPDTTLSARPSVLAPRASSSLLLSVARAGSGYVAAGQRGVVLLSSDGSSWKQVATPADATLNRVQFVDERHGWAVGYDGTILASEDAGSTWTLQQFDAAWGRAYYDVLFVDGQNGFVAGGNGRLQKTADGGKTWEIIESPVFEEQPNLYSLTRIGNGALLLTGERGFIARSDDQGATWTQLKSPYTGSYFGAVAAGSTGVVLFGLRGNAFHAADITVAAALSEADLAALREAAANPEASGDVSNPVSDVAGWARLASDDTESLFGGSAADDGSVLLFGANGRLMKADLAASQLVRLQLPTNINMNAGLATAEGLIVVGTSGVQRFAKP